MRTLRLTQQIGSHELTVYASEFVPQPGDIVSYKWQDGSGGTQELEMPHYCLTNIEKVYSHFYTYISSAKWIYLEVLESEDDLTSMTFRTATWYAKARPVYTTTLSCDPYC